MLALVTGATGLVGNNVVRLLLAQGHQVRVLLRDPRVGKELAGLDVEPIPGDIRYAEQVATAALGCDAVIHSAAMVHIGWYKKELMHEANVVGTRSVAEAALKQGARFVHVSSVDALGVGKESQAADENTPRTGKVECPYVETKRAAEEQLQELFAQGLNGVIVNPGLMFGPFDWKPSSGRMILSVAQKQPPMAPRGGCSACDVRDVAAAIVAAIHKGNVGENYILGGENLRFVDLWRRIAKVTGTRPPFCRMGPLAAAAVAYAGDIWSQMDGKEAEFNSAAVRMGCQFHYYNSQKAKDVLGYRVRPLDETLEAAWQWFQKTGYVTPRKPKKSSA